MFCKNCGKQLPEYAYFCPGCGVKVGGSPSKAGNGSGSSTLAPTPIPIPIRAPSPVVSPPKGNSGPSSKNMLVWIVVVLIIGVVMISSLAVLYRPANNTNTSESGPFAISVTQTILDPAQAQTGYTIYIFNLNVLNQAGSSLNLDAYYFLLHTSGGQVYNSIYASAMKQEFPAVTLLSESKTSGEVAFQVPGNQTPSYLEYLDTFESVDEQVYNIPPVSSWISEVTGGQVTVMGSDQVLSSVSISNSTTFYYSGETISAEIGIDYYGSSPMYVSSLAITNSSFTMRSIQPSVPIALAGGSTTYARVTVAVPSSSLNGQILNFLMIVSPLSTTSTSTGTTSSTSSSSTTTNSTSSTPHPIAVGKVSSSQNALGYASERDTFFGSGLYWTFYFDGSSIVYSTSANGTSWSAPTVIAPATTMLNFSVYFGGTYVNYAYIHDNSLFFGRGLPTGQGTINWIANDEMINIPTDQNGNFITPMGSPSITVDAFANIWISFASYNPNVGCGPNTTASAVVELSNILGNYIVTNGPYDVTPSCQQVLFTNVLYVTGSQIEFVTTTTNQVMIMSWQGGWTYGSSSALSEVPSGISAVSQGAQGTQTNLIVSDSSGFEYISCRYPCTSVSDQSVKAAYQSTITLTQDGNSLYVFGIENNELYYQFFNGHTWSSETPVFNFALSASIASVYSIQSVEQGSENVGVMFVTTNSTGVYVEYGIFSTTSNTLVSSPSLVLTAFIFAIPAAGSFAAIPLLAKRRRAGGLPLLHLWRVDFRLLFVLPHCFVFS